MIILTIILTALTLTTFHLWREVKQLRRMTQYLDQSLDLSDSAINLLLNETFKDEKERKEKIQQALES